MTFLAQDEIKRDFSCGDLVGDFWQYGGSDPVSASSSADRLPHAHSPATSPHQASHEGRCTSLNSDGTPLSGLSSSLPFHPTALQPPSDLAPPFRAGPHLPEGVHSGLLNYMPLPERSLQEGPSQGLPSVCSLDDLRQSHERLMHAASQFNMRGGALAQGAFGDMLEPDAFKSGGRWSSALQVPGELQGMPTIVQGNSTPNISFSDPMQLSLAGRSGLLTSTPEGDSDDAKTGGALDQRRLRRMLSNRESARRSRKRKQALMVDLESENEKLAADNQRMQKELSTTSRQLKSAVAERKQLEAELAALRKQVAELTKHPQTAHQPPHPPTHEDWYVPGSPGSDTEASWSDAPTPRKAAKPRKKRTPAPRRAANAAKQAAATPVSPRNAAQKHAVDFSLQGMVNNTFPVAHNGYQ
ncbi:hypothetical protein WJX72_002035 [[Myrmecia] bisecta]|uniref:BZIP domain-containing protein n=1 Tax=[Myrmecia] bisecta TaxID=41462 RepID=A0AAW1QQJ0_9CHLO